MKIKSLFVGSFGKLKDRKIELSDGINVIYGANEAGKSTLAAFIKYMLYGFSSKAKTADGNDKLKYMPWQSDVAFGSMEATFSGEQYIIERKTGAKNTFSVTREDGDILHLEKEPGEYFLGVNENAFSKMAFIRQTDVSANKMDKLSENVQNILFSADESVNTEKARKKLNDCRNALRSRTRSTGKCYELEEKIGELTELSRKTAETHKQLLEAESRLVQTQQRIAENKKLIAELDAELENINACEAKEILKKTEEARINYENAKERYLAAKDAITFGGVTATAKSIDELKTVLFDFRAAREAFAHANDELIREKALFEEVQSSKNGLSGEEDDEYVGIREKTERNIKKRKVATVVGIILAVIAASILTVYFTPDIALPFERIFLLAGGAASALGAAVMLILAVSASSGISKTLEKYGFDSVKTLMWALDEYPEEKERIFEERRKLDSAKQKYDVCAEKLSEISERLVALASASGCDENELMRNPDSTVNEKCRCLTEGYEFKEQRKTELARFEAAYTALCGSNDLMKLREIAEKYTGEPKRSKEEVIRAKKFAENANKSLDEVEKDCLKLAATKTSVMRKPAEIIAEKQALTSVLAEYERKADALELAIDALDDACEEVREGITPRISDIAGKLFSLFTDGSYAGISLGSEMELGVKNENGIKSGDFLSTGTSDAAYIALRLALCDTLFTEKPVIVLDEAFAYIDDVRTKKIISALKALSADCQILIFTCHKRETELFADDMHLIEI